MPETEPVARSLIQLEPSFRYIEMRGQIGPRSKHS
jgi:hypothetical protein